MGDVLWWCRGNELEAEERLGNVPMHQAVTLSGNEVPRESETTVFSAGPVQRDASKIPNLIYVLPLRS